MSQLEGQMLQEKVISGNSGWAMVGVLTTGILAAVATIIVVQDSEPLLIVAAVLVLVVDAVCWNGLTVVNPNTAKVVQLFGQYQGSIKTPGFRWVNPLTSRRTVSLKVRNFESGKLKVNDHIGQP